MKSDNFQKNGAMFSGDLNDEQARIKIVGVGGAGCNVVDRLQLEHERQVRLAALDTSAQALSNCLVGEKTLIGRSITRGLSTGGETKMGREAAEADRDNITRIVSGMDIVFVVAGLGMGTGTGAAPVVAEIAAGQNAVVIAFVTLPFALEGPQRLKQAEQGLADLRLVCDAVIPLPNELLMQHLQENATVLDAFSQADTWISRGVRSITAMLVHTGLINLDLASLRRAFENRGGKTVFGLGRGEGDDYVNEALNDLALCPLLHTPEFARKADSLLVNIIGGADLGISQVNQIMETVSGKFGSRDSAVMGAVIDDSLHQHLEIVVIGTTDVGTKRFMTRKLPPQKPVPAASSPAPEKADAPRKPLSKPPAPGADGSSEAVDDPDFALSSSPQNDGSAGTKRVHQSKLKTKESPDIEQQEEFLFVVDDEQRGYFERTERNLFEGEDLDVPTFLRLGVKVPV